MPKIRQKCTVCDGTGLYSGMYEAKGEAVICILCDGKGCSEHYYTEFIKRKRKRGIKTIHRSRGSFIATGVGGYGNVMTYAEFEKKIKS